LGDKAFLSVIKPFAIFIFLFVLFLTAYAVPWAKQQKSVAEEKTNNASEFSFITEGKFESFKKGDIVFYASDSTSIDVMESKICRRYLYMLLIMIIQLLY